VADTVALEGQIRGREIQGEPFMKAPSSSETQREVPPCELKPFAVPELEAHSRLEAGLRRLPQYSAVVGWLPYPGEVYDAAIAAEIDAPNTGAVVVLDAYRKEKAT
jgi:hypothetical protein